MTPEDWRRLAELVDQSAGAPEVLARLMRLEADKGAEQAANENPDLPRVGKDRKPYPVAFSHLWQALCHIGGLGNSIKGEAYTAWVAMGRPMDGVASAWGDYIGSLPSYQTTPKHFSRWLKARGWEQAYQPANARPGATGAATAKPTEVPRCQPHRDREIPPHRMGQRWASAGVPCPDCRHVEAKRGDRHTSEDELFRGVK